MMPRSASSAASADSALGDGWAWVSVGSAVGGKVMRRALAHRSISFCGMSETTEIARRLRSDAGEHDCPVLVAATGRPRDSLDFPNQSLFDHYLVKPLGIEELCQLISDASAAVRSRSHAA